MKDFIFDHLGKICFLLLVLIFLLLFYAEEKDCEIKAEGMKLDHEWSFVSGCRIKIDGKLVPLINYRFNEQKEAN